VAVVEPVAVFVSIAIDPAVGPTYNARDPADNKLVSKSMTYTPGLRVKTVPPAPGLATIDAGILLYTSVSIVNAVLGATDMFALCVV
jgi:hypothetical protein